MRQIIHKFIAFLTDIYDLFRALSFQFQNQFFKNEIKREDTDKRLFILGNGASLKSIVDRFDEFKDSDFCVVNFSINTEIFWKIKPKMYVLTDRVYYLFKDREDTRTVREKMQMVNWPMGLYIPYHFPKWIVEGFKQNRNITVCRYNTSPWKPELKLFSKLKYWLYSKGVIAPACTNIIVAAIYTSILKGYKQIYLLGAEHSWMHDVKLNDKNEVVLTEKHYYGTYDRIWVDYDGNPIKITDLLESLLSTFTSYQYLEEFSKYLGNIKIINCTEGSYIDAFERMKIDKVIGSAPTDK